MSRREWYRVKAEADTAHLAIFDEIGRSFFNDDAVTAKQFIADLEALPAGVRTIVVHVNSTGGDVFDAVAIANALRQQAQGKGRTVQTIVEGIAASAASIVVCAGSVRKIADNALVMVHNPYMLTVGNAADHRKGAETLDTIRDTIITTYGWVSPRSAEELAGLMDAETWMDARQALEHGFATEIVEAVVEAEAALPHRVVASLRVPAAYRARVEAFTMRTPDVVRICADAGLDLAFAQTLMAEGGTSVQIQARVETERQVRAAATERERAIRGMCKTTRVQALADGLVRSGMALADVQAHLTTVTALIDHIEIDGSIETGQPARRGPRVDRAAAFKNFNQAHQPAAK